MTISRKWNFFHYLAAGVVAAVTSISAGFGHALEPSKWQERRDAQMIKIAMPSLPKSLDATKLAFAEHFLILQSLCENLVRVDEAGQITSAAADKWEFNENGREVHFSFSKDKKFSDGTPVTAVEVANSLNRHFAPGSSSDVSGYLKKIVDNKSKPFEVENPQTIVVRLKHSYAPLLQLLAMPGFCVQKLSGDGMIGSGPFEVTDRSENLIRLKRNRYFSGDVKLQQIDFVAINSSALMGEKMKSDDIDLALGLQVSEAEHVTPESFQLEKSESLATVHLYFNVERSPELTSDVRSELTAVLQRAAKSNRSMFLEPSLTLLPPEVLPLRYYQRSEIKQASEVARPKKKKLLIRLRGSAFNEKLAAEIASAVEQMGFRSDVKRLSDSEYLNAMKTGAYDILGGRYFLNYPDPDAALEPFDKTSPFRLGRFNSAQLLKQLDAARVIEDNRARLERYTDALLEFEKQHFVVPMYRLSLPIAHRPSIHIPSTSFCHEVDLWKIFWK